MEAKEEQEVRGWIEAITGDKLEGETLHDALKDGVVLCNLINTIDGAPSKFPNRLRASFIQMENICYFIESVRRLGVPDSENFLTVDLFEGKNMTQVIHCIYSLSRNLNKSGRTDIPVIGPKLIEPIKIEFNQQQIDDAKRTVSLQYGYSPKLESIRNNLNSK